MGVCCNCLHLHLHAHRLPLRVCLQMETETTESKQKTTDKADADDEEKPAFPYPKLTYEEELRHSLMIAITSRQAKCAERILETMAQVGVTTERIDKWCPLVITCAEMGDVDTLRVMLKYYKDASVSSKYGQLYCHVLYNVHVFTSAG